MNRGSNGERAPTTRSLVMRLLRYTRPYLLLLAAGIGFSLLFAGGRYGRAYLIKPLLDEVLIPATVAPTLPFAIPLPGSAPSDPEVAGGDPTARPGTPDMEHRLQVFRRILWAALAIVLVVPIAIFGRGYAMHYMRGRISIDIKQEIAAKLLRLPLAFHRQARAGDTVTRLLLDVDQSQTAYKLILVDFFQSSVMIVIGVGTLFAISWQLTLIALGAAPAIVGVLAVFSNRIHRTALRRQAQMGEVTHRILGILSGIKVIKAFRGEQLETDAFRRETDKLFRRVIKVVKNRVLSRSLIEMLNNGIAIGVLMLGAALVLRQQWGITPGDVAAFGAVLGTTYKPVKALSRGWTEIMEATASAERFFQILDIEEEQPDPPEAIRIDGVRHGIRFAGVSFDYGDQPVLRNIDLDVACGEVIALVGPTGSGKTTLVDLLLRFQDPTRGGIEIDGVDLRQIRRDSLLDQVAVVTQEPFLFDTTIRENILYARPEADEAELLEAARAAHVDEFVDQLREGYDTEVGEFGLRLSGGQRQRITIARAILKNASILVFDEATSALDAKTERTVQDAIESLRGQRTVFVVAHRLSTVRRADRIVVIEGGEITQQGRHEDLMAEPSGLYRELIALSGEVAGDVLRDDVNG